MAKTRGNWRVKQCAARIDAILANYDGHGKEETDAVDLLADLMLYAYLNRRDFAQMLESARSHFAVESEPRYSEGRR